MELNVIILCLAVAGLCAIAVWYINGALRTPIGGKNTQIHIAVRADGNVPELEHTVAGILWLIDNGTLPAEVVIIDSGMNDDARFRARALEKRDIRVHYLENWESYGSGERAD